MAITLSQHKVGQSTANATTVDVTVTATTLGRLLVMLAGNGGARTVTGVATTAGANPFTQYSPTVAAVHTVLNFGCDAWWLASAPSGVTTWRVTFSGAAGTFDKNGWFFEVAGFTTPVVDAGNKVSNGTGASNTDTGASITTTATAGFACACVMTGDSITANPKAANEFSAGGDISASANAACSLIYSTAAAHQPAWTDTSAAIGFCSSTVSFKETSGSTPKLKRNSGLNGLGSSGPFFSNPVAYHRTPDISLEAYYRDRARKHRAFLAAVRRAA